MGNQATSGGTNPSSAASGPAPATSSSSSSMNPSPAQRSVSTASQPSSGRLIGRRDTQDIIQQILAKCVVPARRCD